MALHSKILIMLPAGAAGVTARLAWTEDNDVCAISAAASVTSTLAWTEANDGCAISGAATVSAALAWTETDDSLSASGSVTVSASIAWTEADDAYSVSGAVSVTESIAWTETDDVTSIAGSVASSDVTADVAWTEADDSFSIVGSVNAVNQDVIRNFSLKNWREWHKPEDELSAFQVGLEAAQIIADVAEQQAADFRLDDQQRAEELRTELLLRGLEMRAAHIEALNEYRAKMVRDELRALFQQRQDDEDMEVLLVLAALA